MRAFFRRHRLWILGLALLAPCLWLLSQHAALAQGAINTNEILPGQIGTELGASTTDLRITIARIIRVALGLLGTVALLLILYAGFTWMTAGGDDTKVTRAKKILSQAVIGLVIILSAFAIVSFILNALVAATSPGGGGPGGGGGGGGGGFGGGAGGAFRPTGIQPRGSLAKYDVMAAVTFSAKPTDDASNIKANIVLEKIEGGSRTSVDYEPIVENNTIRLKSITPCPAPNADRRCLEPDKDYQITVRAGLKNASTSDPRVISCGIGASCTQSFRTGDAVMTEPPTITFTNPVDGQSVPAGDLIAIQSVATDPNGVATVEYSADGAFFIADGDAHQIAPSTYSSQVVWDTSTITPVKAVSLGARVINIDGDEARSNAVRVTVRPKFCFNNVKDGDEVAVDCGGSCGACTGASCTQGSACASGQCVNGQCVELPIITDFNEKDGKPGNLVTITGRHFGSATGKVTFLGGAAVGDEKEAEIASCSGAWSDERVVIVVPAGAATGPIELTTAGGKKDATNDRNSGPLLSDFQVNDVARPGICSIAPVSVKTGQTVTATGLAFGAAQGASRVQLARAAADCAQIQDWATAAEASQVSPWSDTSFTPTIPNVDTGTDGAEYLMRVVVGGQPSNTGCIRVEPPEAGTEPHIAFLTPVAGSVGTYVSVLGSHFGSGGTVHFKNAAGDAIGDITFPAQCAAGYWQDSSVTVKVPAKFTTATAVQLGAYSLTVVRSDGRSSNAATFTINTDPLPPGLCRVDPDNGPTGTTVTLYGEGFGAISASDLPAFASQHPDAVRFNDNKNAASISQWQGNAINASVPAEATTGPVQVRTFAGATPANSNGVNFQVRDCRSSGGDAICGSGKSCCDDGACRAACGVTAATGGFSWHFSTGPIPVFPVVIENATCQVSPPSTMPSPNPYKGAIDICTDIGVVALRFSLEMDTATLNPANILLDSCGTGAAVSSTCTPIAIDVVAGEYDVEKRTQLMATLPPGGLPADTWYRLTIKDDVTSFGTTDRAAQRLDGDFDGRAGGDYVTTFRTGTEACAITGLDVEPSEALIDSSGAQKTYFAYPLTARCVIPSCVNLRAVWSPSDASKATTVGHDGQVLCSATVSPLAETDPGPPIQIRSEINSFKDFGTLTIDYANPRILDYGPRDCTEACINTVGFARFNTAMETGATAGSVISPNNVILKECRNESCLTFVTNRMDIHPDYISNIRNGQDIGGLLTFGNPTLKPNTYYRAIVMGTVRSTSEAALTGLNYEDNAFSWIFRTRLSADPCGPQKIQMEPPQTTLHYIGAVAAVTALPLSSPDKCAANGQLLNSDTFAWGWASRQTPPTPKAFQFVPNGTLLNTNPILPAGCTSNCLLTGSKPVGTPSCGNGTVERDRGEACDTPGSHGCNANCLLTGNTAANGCGNGGPPLADAGEECDEGTNNGKASSGCSAACLLLGSSPGISACGNGSTGVGEACDDGNADNGDGCSSKCLLEGSEQNVFVCGNGLLEKSEQCDYTLGGSGATEVLTRKGDGSTLHTTLLFSDERNPTRPGFSCTPSCLLRGNAAAGTGTNACGNGVIEPTKGEGCDAGIDNGRLVSGCSETCTKTGSNPEMRAFCGDTTLTVKPFDTAANIANGGGEECEVSAIDPYIDGTQVVEALAQCDAKNSCTGSVSASVAAVTGQSGVSVECSCRSDADCGEFAAASGLDLSCGAGACCYARPAPPTITPVGGNVCRNTQITVTFKEPMDLGSLEGGLVVESCGPGHIPYNGGSWLARAASAVGRFLRSFVGSRVSAAGPCSAIEGDFTHVVDKDGHTVSTFAPKQVLAADAIYHVIVKRGPSGVKTAKGVGYSASPAVFQGEFSTGADVCRFDLVQMSPATELIQDSVTRLPITATAMTDRAGKLEAITGIAGFYDWSWTWATIPENGTVGPILDLTTDPLTPASAKVQAKKGLNGREQVLAIAKITEDKFFQPSSKDQVKVGVSSITVMLCNLPWPVRNTTDGSWAPYVDPQTHFEFYYCRDNAGAPLPELQPEAKPGQSTGGSGLLRFCGTTLEGSQQRACLSDADCDPGDRCKSKDLLFLFDGFWKLSDVIGMRVYENPDRLTPQEWYESQHFSGKTQAATVDGYMAVKDANTVYVGAVDKYGDPELRSYIYVFAFNQNSDPRTGEVFDRLVKNVRFNTNLVSSNLVTNVCKNAAGELLRPSVGSTAVVTCSSELDCDRALPNAAPGMTCDSAKDKIRRDMRRWQDMRSIEASLETIRQQTGSYPKIESGSFVRGFTTSKWPSWSQQLGAAGGLVDPLNDFNHCEGYGSECLISHKACSNDTDCKGGAGDVCRPLFEAATCYSDRIGIFACPVDSHVYQYRSIGGNDYRMSMDFEYLKFPWLDAACDQKTGEDACNASVGCSWLPSGPASGVCQTRITTDLTCGGEPDASAPKKCLANPAVTCTASDQCAAQDACVPLNTPLVGPAAGKSCGNGLIEDDEICEIGMEKTVSCGTGQGSKRQRCGSLCDIWEDVQACPVVSADHCGNGSLESFLVPAETCDDGAQTGSYGRCRSGNAPLHLGCSRRCINVSKRTSFSISDIGSLCTTNSDCVATSVCTDRMNFCGDGVKNGPELCDDGANNGTYGACAWDCRGPGPRCGDNATNGAEQCDGNQTSASGVCIGTGTPLADTATASSASSACAKNSDCASGQTCALCAPTPGGLPQTRTKGCFSATSLQACTFDVWSACKPSGACGNGKMEGAEECDAGTGNSANGACLTTCKKNVCNDGFVQTGVEQCDNGAGNGVRCTPLYGLTCNYCKNDCSIETISGAFCGDKLIQAPPESCDAGAVTGWCSRTYTNLSTPVSNPNDLNPPSDTIRSCRNDNDCLPGVCKLYVTTSPTPTTGASTVSCFCDATESSQQCASHCPSQFVCPATGQICSTNPCTEDSYCYTPPTPLVPTNAACRSSRDCGPTEFCSGGEGQCLKYNTQCVPEPYSNTHATSSSPRFFDGSCSSCTNACTGASSKSPAFCGDSDPQPQFGEQCDGAGDPNAFGTSANHPTTYVCANSCLYDPNGGYCGDKNRQADSVELCDGTDYTTGQGNGAPPSCASLGWGAVGEVACAKNCGYYGGGCSDGALSPGDVRIRVTWKKPVNGSDLDSYLKLPSTAKDKFGVRYGADGLLSYHSLGNSIEEPHARLSRDDQNTTRPAHQFGDNPARDGFTLKYAIEIMTINWRSNGKYWPSSESDPYRFYLQQYFDESDTGSNVTDGVKVTVCTYDATQFNNANCSLVFTSPTGGKARWHVFDLYGAADPVPTIKTVNAMISSAP